MLERALAMLKKEFIQIFREPRMRAVVLVIPIVQLLVFGYAANTDVKNAPLAILDQDNTPASREYVARFIHNGYFNAVAFPQTQDEIQSFMDSGTASAVLWIKPEFQQRIQSGKTAPVQLLLDGSDSNTAGIIMGYCVKISSDYSRSVLISRVNRQQGANAKNPRINLVSRAQFNENLESRNYYLPGVMATMVMLITLMLTSMSIVREREIGAMEQILVTPIKPIEFIIGKTIPFVLIAYIDVFIVTAVGYFWFQIPFRGDFAFLLLCAGLYILPCVGLGLLISTICQTQQQAMLSTFLFFFPAMLLSGFAYPINNMPDIIQIFAYANPLRHFLIIIRGIFLKGNTASILYPEMIALATLGLVFILLAVRRFHKTLG